MMTKDERNMRYIHQARGFKAEIRHKSEVDPNSVQLSGLLATESATDWLPLTSLFYDGIHILLTAQSFWAGIFLPQTLQGIKYDFPKVQTLIKHLFGFRHEHVAQFQTMRCEGKLARELLEKVFANKKQFMLGTLVIAALFTVAKAGSSPSVHQQVNE